MFWLLAGPVSSVRITHELNCADHDYPRVQHVWTYQSSKAIIPELILINLASGVEVPIRDVVKKIADLTETKSKVE